MKKTIIFILALSMFVQSNSSLLEKEKNQNNENEIRNTIISDPIPEGHSSKGNRV